MTRTTLDAKRTQLAEALQETAIRLERLRGALFLCDELLAEEATQDGRATQEGNGLDLHPPPSDATTPSAPPSGSQGGSPSFPGGEDA